MTTAPRLSRRTLDSLTKAGLPSSVHVSPTATQDVTTGIVHLGIGAFHRAHQAYFTDLAMAATGDFRWGIHGVTQRSATVRDQIVPQDGLYGILELSDGAERLDLVGAVRDVSFPAEDTGRILAAIASGTTHLVTLTVTEKGYRRNAAGGPDLSDPAVAADQAQLADELDGAADGEAMPSSSAIGLLMRALARRWRAGGEPLTVVCCDNLLDNGPQVERLVHALVDACGASSAQAFIDWLDEAVAFPATMVDRIVPATSDAHRATAQRLLGAADRGLVVAEPFRQWVIEDRFTGPRPAWEKAGAQLTHDVTPFEQTKLRLLNGTHSTIAYAGALRGHATIAAALDDDEVRALALALVNEDSIPSLGRLDEIDLEEYRDSVLERFANTAIGHTTVQVAMDGSQKLPIRLLGIARDRLASGTVPTATAKAVAQWMLYVRAASSGALEVDGRAVALDDPQAAALGAAAAGPLETLADRMLDESGVFPSDLAGDDRWRSAVRDSVRDAAPSAVSA